MQTTLPNRLIDTKEAADILGLCPFTLRKWRTGGEGPVYTKLGRSVRYDPRDLQSFIESGRQG